MLATYTHTIEDYILLRLRPENKVFSIQVQLQKKLRLRKQLRLHERVRLQKLLKRKRPELRL